LSKRILFIILLAVFILINHIAFAVEGFSSNSKYLNPGKIDVHYLYTKTTDEYNFILWTPVFKGGVGVVDYDTGGRTEYSGGYFRPLLPQDGKGELILGFLAVDTSLTYSYEFQGEYRFPSGIGVGGGFVSREDGGNDVEFGKISFRNIFSDWNYIIEVQCQEIADKKSPGGYATVYNDNFMFTYGNDGEQWRTVFGYIAEENKSIFRPAFEILYVDNTIGSVDGNQFLFINTTLKYKGGFLSHPARLGRAMGPQGLEFGNPLGFLSPTWNRRLDVWELGDLADFRLVRLEKPSGITTEKYEALMFPFQFDRNNDLLDSVYLGFFYSKDSSSSDSPGIMGGIFGKSGFLKVGLGADYNFDTDEKQIFIGIIDKF